MSRNHTTYNARYYATIPTHTSLCKKCGSMFTNRGNWIMCQRCHQTHIALQQKKFEEERETKRQYELHVAVQRRLDAWKTEINAELHEIQKKKDEIKHELENDDKTVFSARFFEMMQLVEKQSKQIASLEQTVKTLTQTVAEQGETLSKYQRRIEIVYVQDK